MGGAWGAHGGRAHRSIPAQRGRNPSPKGAHGGRAHRSIPAQRGRARCLGSLRPTDTRARHNAQPHALMGPITHSRHMGLGWGGPAESRHAWHHQHLRAPAHIVAPIRSPHIPSAARRNGARPLRGRAPYLLRSLGIWCSLISAPICLTCSMLLMPDLAEPQPSHPSPAPCARYAYIGPMSA